MEYVLNGTILHRFSSPLTSPCASRWPIAFHATPSEAPMTTRQAMTVIAAMPAFIALALTSGRAPDTQVDRLVHHQSGAR
jgi:hypothetical protein